MLELYDCTNSTKKIATPGHAEYGNHLDYETVLSMIAPRQESVDLVKGWLAKISHSNVEVTVQGDYITVEASINKVEELLNAEYSTFGK